MEYNLPRGLRDIEPSEYKIFEYIRETFKEVSRIFNFSLMEPSTLEFLKTLEAKNESIREEIYWFKDKSGRDVALRFDLTVGLARYVAQKKELTIPVKLGAFGGMWRYDEPQFARYRWFHQWDIEIFDNKNIFYDAEVIDFVYNFFKRLGLRKFSIEIGDRRIINEFLLKNLKIEDEAKRMNFMRALDKASKKSFDEIWMEYRGKEIDKESLEALFKFAEFRGNRVLDTLKEYNLEAKELSTLVDLLKSRGVEYNLNMSIVRGLDYYNGIVFEVFDDEARELGALAGGGRYDPLPKVFGREDLGATGVAGGIERILLALKKEEISIPSTKKVVIVYTLDLQREALQLCSNLRKSSIACECLPEAKSFKKQLSYANKIKAEYAVILATKEFRDKKVIVRDMLKGEEKLIFLEDLTKYLTSNCAS